MIVRTRERHLTQYGGKGPLPPPCIVYTPAAGTWQNGPLVIGEVRVQSHLDRSHRNPHRLALHRRFYCLEVESFHFADQSFDLPGDLGLELFFEPPFFAVAFATAS